MTVRATLEFLADPAVAAACWPRPTLSTTIQPSGCGIGPVGGGRCAARGAPGIAMAAGQGLRAAR